MHYDLHISGVGPDKCRDRRVLATCVALSTYTHEYLFGVCSDGRLAWPVPRPPWSRKWNVGQTFGGTARLMSVMRTLTCGGGNTVWSWASVWVSMLLFRWGEGNLGRVPLNKAGSSQVDLGPRRLSCPSTSEGMDACILVMLSDSSIKTVDHPVGREQMNVISGQ